MKYFESAYDLPCYNYAKIVTGDIRYLIDDRISNYPKKLSSKLEKKLASSFEEILKELPGGFNKENTLENALKIEILNFENSIFIFENVERLFYYLELTKDVEYKKKIASKIQEMGVQDLHTAKTYKNHYINNLAAKKKELNDHLIKLKKDNVKTEFNEKDFFNSIIMVSNATSIDLNPKNTSIADFLSRYNLLVKEQKKKIEKKELEKING